MVSDHRNKRPVMPLMNLNALLRTILSVFREDYVMAAFCLNHKQVLGRKSEVAEKGASSWPLFKTESSSVLG